MIVNTSTKNKKYLIDSIKRCNLHRKRILDISQKVNALHAAGAFSALEMVDTIYHKEKPCLKMSTKLFAR